MGCKMVVVVVLVVVIAALVVVVVVVVMGVVMVPMLGKRTARRLVPPLYCGGRRAVAAAPLLRARTQRINARVWLPRSASQSAAPRRTKDAALHPPCRGGFSHELPRWGGQGGVRKPCARSSAKR